MMGETDLTEANVVTNGIRYALSLLDLPFFGLLAILYQLFFNVASVELFSKSIMKFFERVQIIIGIYMMFQLAVTILRGIVDPDSFMKNQGGSKGLVPRIIISLTMLALIVPVKTSGGESSEFAAQINNQGLLFGTLSSLQYRIINNNTIGKLVLGVNDTSSNFINSEDDEDSEQLETSARIFASTVLKGFYRINLIPEADRDESDNPDGKADDQVNAYRMCKSISTDIINDDPPGKYNRIDADPSEIIGMINETCTSTYEPSDASSGGLLETVGGMFSTGTKRYVFVHIPILSAIVAGIFCVILLSFTIDIAVRMIKLAMLRLIAPIPIISYMDPNGSKDGAFSSWWKTLLSTYLDLFVRLASVYFVIFLIQDMITYGIIVNKMEGPLGAFTTIAVFIGLFAFAKQAPKFFREILGLKGEGSGFFSGFGAIGAAAGLISAGAGVAAAIPGAIGSGLAHARASRMADETRANLGEKTVFGNDVDPDGIFNRGKHVVAGIAGALTGGVAGAHAAATAKDHAFDASVNAMRQRNASAISRGNDGSTLLGTWGSTASNIFTGEGRAAAVDRDINSNKNRLDALKAIKSRVSGEMVKADWTSGSLGLKDSSGNDIATNYKRFMATYEAAKSSGATSMVVHNDITGRDETISMEAAEYQKGYLLKTNENDYVVRNVNGTATKIDDRLLTLVHNAEVLGGSANFVRNADGTIEKGDNIHITNRDAITNGIDGFEDYNTQLARENSINKANDRHSGDKK